MAVTVHVYQIYISSPAERVWQAITESEWTRQYFHTTQFVEPPRAGQPYRTVTTDGRDAVEGMVEEMTPPTADAPGRFVQTWHVLYDAALAAEPPGRVEWTVEQVGDDLTRVRLVHGDLAFSPLTWARVKDGWVWILDGLKTLLETGRPLPEPASETPVSETPTGDWHRSQGIEANNSVWDLLGLAERSPEDDEELLRRAYAAAYHWSRATGSGAANEIRASYMIARALVATGQPDRALVNADRCLALCREHGIADFDLAYAHEARARALWALGRDGDGDAAIAEARAVPIADPEDLAVVEKDFADLPHYG
jgi:uncharacterized protein YndB with AHSA1/START domain